MDPTTAAEGPRRPGAPTGAAATVIAAVEAIPLHIPQRADSTPGASLWGAALTGADTLLVKVTTVDGTHGWGEAFGYLGVDLARQAVEQLIGPLCVGRDAAAIRPLMRQMHKQLHVFGRGGALSYALSAVDIALWDIAGKMAGVPVYRLLGGGAAEFPCYASLASYRDPAAVRVAVRRALDAGFQTIKLHESSLPAIHAAREEAGPEIGLIVDAGCAWSLTQARSVAAELLAVGLRFLEEPLWPPENFAGLAELRAATGLPVAAGENVTTLLDFERMLATAAVDFVQPSPAKMGGITELCKVFPLADAHNVTVMTHSFYDGPGLLAALHVTAGLGSAESMIEWRRFELEASVYGDALRAPGGRIAVPPGPGLGIDPDPAVISAYRVG